MSSLHFFFRPYIPYLTSRFSSWFDHRTALRSSSLFVLVLLIWFPLSSSSPLICQLIPLTIFPSLPSVFPLLVANEFGLHPLFSFVSLRHFLFLWFLSSQHLQFTRTVREFLNDRIPFVFPLLLRFLSQLSSHDVPFASCVFHFLLDACFSLSIYAFLSVLFFWPDTSWSNPCLFDSPLRSAPFHVALFWDEHWLVGDMPFSLRDSWFYLRHLSKQSSVLFHTWFCSVLIKLLTSFGLSPLRPTSYEKVCGPKGNSPDLLLRSIIFIHYKGFSSLSFLLGRLGNCHPLLNTSHFIRSGSLIPIIYLVPSSHRSNGSIAMVAEHSSITWGDHVYMSTSISLSPHVLGFLFPWFLIFRDGFTFSSWNSQETPSSFTILIRTPVDYCLKRSGEEIMFLKELGLFPLYVRNKGHGPTFPWHAHETPTVYQKHSFLPTLLRGRIDSDACSMVDIHPFLVPCYFQRPIQ